jgi:hypothetical protein
MKIVFVHEDCVILMKVYLSIAKIGEKLENDLNFVYGIPVLYFLRHTAHTASPLVVVCVRTLLAKVNDVR